VSSSWEGTGPRDDRGTGAGASEGWTTPRPSPRPPRILPEERMPPVSTRAARRDAFLPSRIPSPLRRGVPLLDGHFPRWITRESRPRAGRAIPSPGDRAATRIARDPFRSPDASRSSSSLFVSTSGATRCTRDRERTSAPRSATIDPRSPLPRGREGRPPEVDLRQRGGRPARSQGRPTTTLPGLPLQPAHATQRLLVRRLAAGDRQRALVGQHAAAGDVPAPRLPLPPTRSGRGAPPGGGGPGPPTP